jgi:hypothetical protein
MIETEKGNAGRVQCLGQRELLWGVPGAEKTVGADHKRRTRRRRQVKPSTEQQTACGKGYRLPGVDVFYCNHSVALISNIF